MKRSKLIILNISVGLIVIGVIVSSFLTKYSSTIASVTTTVTALIGALALFIQFKKDKETNQASFMISFHETFYDHQENIEILDVLDNQANGKFKEDLTDEKYYKKIMSYLGWIRTLCTLIDNKVLSIKAIDDIFSYKFFAITNNKQVQDVELIPNAKYYKLIYKVHSVWTEYKIEKDKYVVFSETSLNKTNNYNELIKWDWLTNNN